MNFKKWLLTLQDTISRWSECKSFTLIQNNVSPPQKRSDILTTLQTSCKAQIPEDLIQFYTEAAGGCDIHYQFEIMPESETSSISVCGMDTNRRINGGLGLISPEEVSSSQRKLRKLHAYFKEEASLGKEDIQKVGQMEEFLDASIPIWSDWGDTTLFIVRSNSVLKEGLYWIELGGFLELERATALVDSFSQWLQFLEENLYIGGSGMSESRYFTKQIPDLIFRTMSLAQILAFDAGPLVGNPEFCNKIREMAKLP